MRIFNSIRKKSAGVIALGFALTLIPVGVAMADWGPARPTFTWNSPATYITFNSITDNPQYGDERKFISARDINNPQYSKSVDVQNNEELYVQIYYHNNAASNYNLTATNTRVRFALPHTPATSTYINGHISASNANPADVQDSVDLTGSAPFTVEYEPGSAQIWNNVYRGAALSDNIVTSSGALIGYNQMDGNLPGCSQYSGYVTIRVRIHMQTPQVSTYTATATASATASASAKASCPNSGATASASASATATATATATSNISQADADQKAQSAAQQQANTNAQAEAQANAQAKAKAEVNCQTTTPPTVTTTSAKPPTPSTPSSLPNTGPGDVLGIFAGASAFGTAGRWLVLRRRR